MAPSPLIVGLTVLLGAGCAYSPGRDALKSAEASCAKGDSHSCIVGVAYKDAMIRAGTPDALPPDFGVIGLLGLFGQALVGVGGTSRHAPYGHHWQHGYHYHHSRY